MEFEKRYVVIELLAEKDGKEEDFTKTIEFIFTGEVYAHACGMVEGLTAAGWKVTHFKIKM